MDSPLPDPILELIRHARRYEVGRYHYFVWPFKGITAIEPGIFRRLLEDLQSLVPPATELLVSFMTDGDLLTSPLAQRMQLPFQIFRDFNYQIPHIQRLHIRQKTNYFSRDLYMERPSYRNICLVDAVVSTGATILAATEALRSVGHTITGIVTPLYKANYGGIEAIQQQLGIEVKALYEWCEGANGDVEIRRVAP